MEFLHTMIRVKDIEESLKFYQELLEMKCVKEKNFNDCTLYFLTDKNGVCQIELTYNYDHTESDYELGDGFGHFAFKVESMDDFTKKLKAFGYRYQREPYKLTEGGSTIAFIKDPDGYEIELIEKIK